MKFKFLANISLCVAIGLSHAQTSPAAMTDEEEKVILNRLHGLHGVPEKDRRAVTKQLALNIKKLPADEAKVSVANVLAILAIEENVGHNTLQEVATTLAQALRETRSLQKYSYSQLAQMVRYEHVKVSLNSPQFKAALATLEDKDRAREKANFTLTDLRGKAWTLKDLSGHVVLVKFWATWCTTCSTEMPDLNALYERFKSQGLIILAISDKDSKTVTAFLSQHPVGYPILLDTGHKVNELFHVEAIPKSYLYNRQGVLAAEAIDMPTRAPFMDLLKRAGLQ